MQWNVHDNKYVIVIPGRRGGFWSEYAITHGKKVLNRGSYDYQIIDTIKEPENTQIINEQHQTCMN